MAWRSGHVRVVPHRRPARDREELDRHQSDRPLCQHDHRPMTRQNDDVSLRHIHAPHVDLPAPKPKPTSITNQFESTVTLWDGGPIAAGVWECGPGEFTADRSTTTEVCHIISGSGT